MKTRTFYLRPRANAKLLLLLLLLVLGGQPLLAQTPPEGFSSVAVSADWEQPVGLTFNKSGSQLFIWERPGKVWTLAGGQKSLLLDISEEVGAWADFGLLGLALHPQFESNGYFYVLYTVDRHHLLNYGPANYNPYQDEYYNATISRLTRYTATKTATGYHVNPASRKVLLGATQETGIPILHTSHGPGSLVFGADGSLLLSAGDGASFNSTDVGSAGETYYAQALADGLITPAQNVGSLRAQQLESYNGKVLRLDPETGNGVANNPFYDGSAPGAVRSKVWALGLRNPFRMTLKPGTGSATNPGVLYIGDVGYDTWEEINAAVRPGMNFGWPLFEGLTVQEQYWNAKTFNPYAPTGGAGGCNQPYFYFQDLIQQATPTGTATFSSACTGQSIPAGIATFVHSRPLIDWGHDFDVARTGTFSGNTASEANLGAPGSPVAGPQFSGSSALAGVFYPHADFPAEYQNTLFFGDYPSGWIRSLQADGSDQPVAVRNFIDQGAVVVGMATHPTEGGLYYVNFYPAEIRKVVYNAPPPANTGPVGAAPVAVAAADKTYGPGPLTVQFTGGNSYDPDGQALTYRWDFGDGTTSTAANPAHTFPAGGPTNYPVTLILQDNGGTGQATLTISANNTPPQVRITSPAGGTQYPLTGQTTYNLRAAVTDAEHGSGQLRYAWQTTLHHDDHQHPEPVDTSPEATATVSPLGCGPESYHYRITLTVTDALGLASTQEVRLYPNCTPPPANQAPVASAGADVSLTLPTNQVTLRGSGADPDGAVSAYAWTQVGGPAATLGGASAPDLTVSGLAAGTYAFRLTVTDNAGAPAFDEVTLTVNPAPAPPNQAPVASAGGPVSLTLPANSITLRGSGSDADGFVSAYAWTQLGGPAAGLSGTTTPDLALGNLVAATYSFRLTVTDNAGATASADATVTVNPALTPMPTPTPPAVTGPQVVSFALVNGDTGQLLEEISEGEVLNLAAYPTKNFNIRALTSAAPVGRVEFSLTGAEAFDYSARSAPFEAFKGNPGKKGTWLPVAGGYTLVATPYEKNGGGPAGTGRTLRFSVAGSASVAGVASSKAARSSAALVTNAAALSAPLNQLSCYPNPFREEFTVQVPGHGPAKLPLKVYDLVGRTVLALDDLPAGPAVRLGRHLSTGVYTLVVGSGADARRYTLLKE